MGGIEIIVPPGLNVDANGVAIMGGFESRARQFRPAARTRRVLRINGFVLMGGVEITVRLAGETGKGCDADAREPKRKQLQAQVPSERGRPPRRGSPRQGVRLRG